MMIQVKEFLDTNFSTAESKANEFLATLAEHQIINVHYSTGYRHHKDSIDQRSNILVVYRTDKR